MKRVKIRPSDEGTACVLADKGYDSSKLRTEILSHNFKPIIPFNKRNIKDKSKIKHLSKDEYYIYKRRIKIEHFFSWIKKNKRISEVNEKREKAFMGFVYLAACIIIQKHLQT